MVICQYLTKLDLSGKDHIRKTEFPDICLKLFVVLINPGIRAHQNQSGLRIDIIFIIIKRLNNIFLLFVRHHAAGKQNIHIIVVVSAKDAGIRLFLVVFKRNQNRQHVNITRKTIPDQILFVICRIRNRIVGNLSQPFRRLDPLRTTGACISVIFFEILFRRNIVI